MNMITQVIYIGLILLLLGYSLLMTLVSIKLIKILRNIQQEEGVPLLNSYKTNSTKIDLEEYIELARKQVALNVECTNIGNYVKYWDQKNGNKVYVREMTDRLYEYCILLSNGQSSSSADIDAVEKAYEQFIRNEKLNTII